MLPAIEAAPNATLVATASRSSDVPQRWCSTDVGTYEAVLEHPNVEAVYIPLPNGMHREWTEKAAASGKHVLCEKPLASDVETARAMVEACSDAEVLLAEAWMTPFSDRYQHVIDEAGFLDELHRVETAFTFTIGPEAADNYRWDPEQGGGALLDVGIYCLGPIIELFDATPSRISASQQLSDRGVDASTTAELRWTDGRSASIRCSFIDDEAQTLRITGKGEALSITSEAFTGGVGDDSYTGMVNGFAQAVRGEWEWPRPVERSIEMLALIERIKEAARD